MKTLQTLLTLSTSILLMACASQTAPGAGPVSSAKANEHAAHQAAAPSTTVSPAMHERMKNMQAMRDKMMNAKTPAERQALMAEHMKSMHEGMEMMKGMGGTQGMPGMTGMKHMPMDPAKHLQMMEMRMDMMHTMMEMMMQRMPGATTPPASP